jgi:hypothetical protein
MCLRFTSRVLVLTFGLTVVVWFMFAGSAMAAGKDYAFYNGDTCKNGNLSACLSRSGAMNYGTLFLNSYGNSTKWRGGSGNGSTNRCATNQGPIPQGNASILTHYDNKNDGNIHGRAWQLSDMHCDPSDPNSTLRTALFLHTEETDTQGQTCGTPYDERWCWDGPNDYYSEGCVKVSHTDVAAVDSKWHAGSDGTPTLIVDA